MSGLFVDETRSLTKEWYRPTILYLRISGMKPERNAPCPCGSGKKYKRCCGLQTADIGNAASIGKARSAYEHGDLQETMRICNEILVLDPPEPTANHLRGLVELQHENFDAAEKYIQIAARARPRDAFIRNSLGMVLHRMGNWPDAEKEFQAALEFEPKFAEAHSNLGNLLLDMQRLDEAIAHFRKAVALDKTNVLFVCNLGALYQGCKEYIEAERCYKRAIEIAPRFSPAYGNLGVLYLQQGRFEDAVDYLHKAELLNSSDPQLLNNLGQAWYRLREFDRSIDYYQRAKAIDPLSAPILINLGLALMTKGDYKKASEVYLEAITLAPDLIQAYQNYFAIVLVTGVVDGAHDLAKKILEENRLWKSLLPELLSTFGQVCDFARRAKVFRLFRELAQAGEVSPEIMRRMLMSINYLDNVDTGEFLAWHLYCAADMETHVREAARSRVATGKTGSRLRIGYISPDFREHSVGYFMRHLFSNHDKSRFITYCYAISLKRDAITQFVESHSDQFKTVVHLDDRELVELIRQDKIDILVDLAGHTEENRIPVFAHRLAPVQISYLGYPNTTGLKTMDYRISDPFVDIEPDKEFTERMLSLPECFLCFGGFDGLTVPPLLSPRKDGKVTFGSFNNLMKITPRVIRLWSAILTQVPNSRMLIKAKGADAPVSRRHLLSEFSKYGIASSRIEMVGMVSSNQEHRNYYRNVDIALDTFPYQGTTTTCEALWMGVPVVILVGQRHRQRVGLSILKNAGIEETISYTEDEYVAIAARLAQNLDALERLRRNIHISIRASVLCDPVYFTRQLESAYLMAWKHHIEMKG
jgi:protein O-GlcNAc transferase